MTQQRKRLIHISRCRGLTRRMIRKILLQDSSLLQIYSLSPTQISQLFSVPIKNATLFYQDLHNVGIRKQLHADLVNFKTITILDENYPRVLNTIKDAPLVLYAIGDVSLLSLTPSLSVIGTRSPTNEAMRKVEYIVKPLVKYQWIIVSGMAKGIDSFAHQVSLENNGKTIAVLGGGFHHVYPKQNLPLFHQITEMGLIISEYAPDCPPAKYHFPERNRIISGLSFGTLVIEATERSGTLITVDQALDQGREVFAVPGSPLVPQTKGCHQLIQDGAKLVTDAEDIMEDWVRIKNYQFI
ncbi:DNA-processing protein DprA [Oceanobacillus chungangensis]|uniref:DNA-protecting protein DprA n=1 Tax=Oceanobacillus chungangensis TaxID=1229152 RepID=A0A3D8PQK4_9BACI|nr:DNA-processing protein DprA [Oceanobacillus chungangensis]RDW17847.1 DNA-protecting protein DprA [Oceanobacillus chungangensis]